MSVFPTSKQTSRLVQLNFAHENLIFALFGWTRAVGVGMAELTRLQPEPSNIGIKCRLFICIALPMFSSKADSPSTWALHDINDLGSIQDGRIFKKWD